MKFAITLVAVLLAQVATYPPDYGDMSMKKGKGKGGIGQTPKAPPPICPCFDVDMFTYAYDACTVNRSFSCWVDENGESWAKQDCDTPFARPTFNYTATEPNSCDRVDAYEGPKSSDKLGSKKLENCRDTIEWMADYAGDTCSSPPPAPTFYDLSGGWTETAVPVCTEGAFSIYYESYMYHDHYQYGVNVWLKVFNATPTLEWYMFLTGDAETNNSYASNASGTPGWNGAEANNFYGAQVLVYDGTDGWMRYGQYQYQGSRLSALAMDYGNPATISGTPYTGAHWPFQSGYTWYFKPCDPDCGTNCGQWPGCGGASVSRFFLWCGYELTMGQVDWLVSGGDPVP